MVRRVSVALILIVALFVGSASVSSVTRSVHAAPVAAHVASPAGAHAALFDKTRVVLHLALAFGVFHHWVYKPFRAGTLGVSHPLNLVKAGAALLFAVHELKKAYQITSTSNSSTLKALNGVLSGMTTKFESIGTLFHKNPSSLTDTQVSSSVNDLNSQVNSANKIMSVPDAPVSKLPSF